MQYKDLLPDRLGMDSRPPGEKSSYFSLAGWRPTCTGNFHPKTPDILFHGRTPLQLKTAAKILTCLVLMASLVLCGCSYPNCPNSHNNGSYPTTTVKHSTPIQTNLYGDLREWEVAEFSAKPFASLIQHSFCEEGGDFDPDVSADGNWIVLSSLRHSPNPDIYIKQTNGSTTTRLTSDPASEIQPCFSPEGDKVAYAGNRSGNWDIWIIGIDGTNPTQLTNSPNHDIHPSWSPDGKQIVYCSLGARSQQWELWVVSAENPSMKKWIGYGLFPAWCPNPQIPKIAFQQARFRGSQWFSIWTIDLIDGEARYPTEIITSVDHACICPDWSADGNWLAYSTVSRNIYEKTEPPLPENLSSGEDIWIVALDGRNNLRLTQSDASNFSPCFGPDETVYFCSDRNGIENIWSIKPHQIRFNQQNPVDLSKHPQNTVKANY